MKLLILTQKVDREDSNLGSFHPWIEEFAKYCESVTVVCLQEGMHNLPVNVSVKSLGKEKNASKLIQFLRLTYYALQITSYNSIFVHMNPEYLVLFGWWWRLFGRRISLWYTHKHVDFKLRVAEKFAHVVFTASRESFRLPSKKIHVVGHGIDTDFFSPLNGKGDKIITAGRISSSKHIREMIDVVGPELVVAGAAITERDKQYEKGLKGLANFVGPISYQKMPDFYRRGKLFLNLSTTGSIDRAVLEALACEVPVVTTNEAFKFQPGIYTDMPNLKSKIGKVLSSGQQSLRNYVEENHSLKHLIPKIVKVLEV